MHFQLENIAEHNKLLHNKKNTSTTLKTITGKYYLKQERRERERESVLFLDFTEQIIYEIAFTRRVVYKGHAKAHWE